MPKIALRILSLLLFLGLLALGLRLLLPVLAFHPTRELLVSPRDVGLEYEDVTLTAADGVRLHGWCVRASEPRAALLFFHGNGGNIGDRLESLEIFHELGLSVLLFDYRGYGKSEGAPDVAGTALDADAAWSWLTRETPTERVVVFGRSLGGAVAMELMRRVKPRAAILESTFSSPFGVLGIDFLSPFLRLAVGDVWNSATAARSLTVPALCLHSPDDEIVPYREGRRLYEALAGEKAFVELRGDHNRGFLRSLSVYRPALDAFLTRHFGPWPR